MKTRLALLLTLALLALAGCGSASTLDVAQTTATTGTTLIAVGDIACAPGATATATTCRQADTAALARRFAPNIVATLGDEQYQSGAITDFRGSYDTSWGTMRGITRPVPGNHEYYTDGAAGYFEYFAGRTPARGYYRVPVNGWQLYFLNSNCDKIDCAAEQRWLASQMRAYPSRCSLIAMHHARFSSGGEHGNDLAVQGLWEVAYAHGVDIALAGHDHDYERFNRLDPEGRYSSRGITSFVAGMGGKSHHPVGTVQRGSAYRNFTDFGVLRLYLTPGKAVWGFRTIDARTLDNGSRSC